MIKLNDMYASVQGEGCLVGTPMVVIRTQGCGVGCPWCDTKETWVADPSYKTSNLEWMGGGKPYWGEFDEFKLVAQARRLWPGIGWALITGGEPAEQDLGILTGALYQHGFKPALETSGTALGHMGGLWAWICVSPKIGMPGGKPFLPVAMTNADEIKWVVGKSEDIESFDRFIREYPSLGAHGVEFCVQPVSQSAKATELCYQACLDRGWRLSLQTHKYMDKP